MKVVEHFAGNVGAIQARASRHYIEILRKGESSSEHERDQLLMAAHALGKSPDDVAKDFATIGQAIHLEREIAALAELDRVAVQRKEEADKTEHEVRGQKAALDARLSKAKEVASLADADARNCRDLSLQLSQLRNTNPELLGIPKN